MENNLSVSNWLLFCCALVFLMTSVGAATRLTESGLSITEWKPIIGAVPPMNAQEWDHAFDLYKQSPEFKKKNSWMKMEDFKKIFFWEWGHRLLGRIIGIVYAIPFFWFLMWRKIPDGYTLKLFGVLILGGLQGAMGWYMVKSGLVDRPDVSHYRLAAHLGLALLIYGSMLWLALSLRNDLNPPQTGDSTLYRHGWIVLLFIATTICWGAFTAGLDAGQLYNDTFPRMGRTYMPHDLWHLTPPWKNFVENPSGVQFAHRWLAMTTGAMILIFWYRAVLRQKTFFVLHLLLGAVCVQIALGVATLFSHVALPLAAAHQAGALMVLTLLIASLENLRE